MRPPEAHRRVEAVVLGGSSGAVEPLKSILSRLPGDCPWPVAVVLHVSPLQESDFAFYIGRGCALEVREAEDKEPALPGRVYFAPPGYHLLVEADRSFSLSVDERVRFARPSLDVLFESAADAYGPGLAGVVLSGAGDDGARGLARVRERGGLAVVQDPAEALHAAMPLAALEAAMPQAVLDVQGIAALLAELAREDHAGARP
ncbi:Chemotaxis response regulator protein-glutamate methylesterase [Fundidesulfovibrio magnetotacticus]|uniref:protein-glutamate methylesterase n=1 Tax=Fundidesulfovibrio magnetotacticus TaxID=2730080 RepID=A0A6V8LWM8_9BACT|nr:chemotaxis protein CheB [Fundidesulfovibrio magnetotacticus]GFK94216.1 Chemotaxis response regulator protein-glutamate methylesterase [Fundidesulfovibrio magnetotacticus]